MTPIDVLALSLTSELAGGQGTITSGTYDVRLAGLAGARRRKAGTVKEDAAAAA